MFKYLGQHIFDFVSKFRNKVYLENLKGSSGILSVADDGEVEKLPTISDVNTWAINYDNRLDLNPPEASPTGITFKPDGTKVFTIGYSLNRVQSYDLSTAWDLTSAGSPTQSEYLVQNNLSSTQEDFFIDSSGTRMYVLSRSSDSIGQFTLNTPWDISDITFVQDVHLNSTSLSGGVAGFVTGEPDPAGLTFKPDGTILYIVGYNQDKVHQIPLSTAWDISTHGTISEFGISPATASQAIQFSSDGKQMYVLGYSLDGIAHFTLSTAWDVTTASLTEQGLPFVRIFDGTPTGFYFNDVEGKAFVCGRSSDFAYEVKATDAVKFTTISASNIYGNNILADTITTASSNLYNSFNNASRFHTTLITDSTTYLGYYTSAPNIRLGDNVYGGGQVNIFRNVYTNNIGGNVPELRIMQPRIGGRGTVKIGKEYESTNYLEGGVIDIESEASTFDHLGEFTLGGELKVGGTKPLAYKDPNLYTKGTQIVLDNFTESTDTELEDHTPDVGSGYTVVWTSSGFNDPLDVPLVKANEGCLEVARNNSNDGVKYVNDTTISTDNYEVRAVIKKQYPSDDPFFLVVKYIDEDNYFVMHFASNYNYCVPVSVINGTYTEHGVLYYYANTSTADNLGLDVAVRVVGNQVSVFYEGEYRGSKTVNISGAGKAGLGFGRSGEGYRTSFDLTGPDQMSISKFEVYELPDSLFDGSDSVHYIENGQVAIGTTTPTANKELTIQTSDDVNGGIRLLRSNGIQYLDLKYAQVNAGGFQTLQVRGDYGVFSYLNQNRSSGHAFGFTKTGGRRLTDTDAEQAWMWIDPDIGQSGTANYVGLLMDVTETSVGSGTNSLMDLRVGGTSKFMVRNDGNVGIGTTSPTDKLHIQGSFGNNTFKVRPNSDHTIISSDQEFRIATTNSADIFIAPNGLKKAVFKATGNFGIGTTSPQQLLDITATTAAPVLRLSRNENIGGTSWAGESLGDIEFYTNDPSNAKVFGKISVVGGPDSGTPNAGFPDGHMVFSTAGQQGGNLSEKMRITDEGNVGIGTTTPAAKLDVSDSNSKIAVFRTTNANADLYLRASGTGSDGKVGIRASANDLRFISNGAIQASFNGSNFGIGTTSPAVSLDVDGQVHLGPQSTTGFPSIDIASNGRTTIRGSAPALTVRDQNNNGGYIDMGGGTLANINSITSSSTLLFSSTNVRFGGDLAARVNIVGQDSSSQNVLGLKQGASGSNIMIDIRDSSNVSTMGITSEGGFYFRDSDLVGRYTFDHDYAPSPADGLTTGFEFRTENASGVLTTFGYIDVTNDDRTAQESSMRLSVGQSTPTEIMRLQSDGNVGIGTTSPAAKLDVNGSIYPTTHNGGTLGLLQFKEWSYVATRRITGDNNRMELVLSNETVILKDHNTIGDGIQIKSRGSVLAQFGDANGSGNVGIGTTSPTEKLEVSGNIKASGTIKGKMEQMFTCSFADDLGTTKHYLPFTSNNEQTNVHADQAAMVMPYHGRVKAIQMRLSNIDAAGDRTFGIETIAAGTNMYASAGLWSIQETETYTLEAADDYKLVNYVFDNSEHFRDGDLLAISIEDSTDLYTASRQTYVTVIIEYDLNNGMGNDTETTKYG